MSKHFWNILNIISALNFWSNKASSTSSLPIFRCSCKISTEATRALPRWRITLPSSATIWISQWKALPFCSFSTFCSPPAFFCSSVWVPFESTWWFALGSGFGRRENAVSHCPIAMWSRACRWTFAIVVLTRSYDRSLQAEEHRLIHRKGVH